MSTDPPTPDRIRQAVQAEREACVDDVEHCYRQLAHGHGANPEAMVRAIIDRIRARGRAEQAGETS